MVGADAVAVIAPPYFALDADELLRALRGGRARVRPAAVLRLRVRGAQRLCGPARRDRAPARGGAEPRRAQGVRHAVGEVRAVPRSKGSTSSSGRRRSSRRASRGGAVGAVSGLAAASPTRSSRSCAIRRRSTARASARCARRCRRCRSTPRRRWCSACAACRCAAACAPPLRGLSDDERDEVERIVARMARIVVAGSGAIGASVAYHLALLGADDVVVAERGELCGGSTVACDGRRAAAVLDRGGGRARAREHRVPRGARAGVLPAGRLSLPRDDRGGSRRPRGAARAAERARRPGRARRSVRRRRASPTDDVLGATCCWSDGVADPPRRRARGAASRGRARRRGARARRRGGASSATCS